MAREKLKFHKWTVALWIFLGALMTLVSIWALVELGIEVLFLLVLGWIVGPFFVWWVYKKAKQWGKGGRG